MKTTEFNMEQRSLEWFKARMGCVTGSAVSNVLAKIKTGEAKVRQDYRLKLVTERLTGQPVEESFVNLAMQWGIDQEIHAMGEYESRTSIMVEKKGFIRVDNQFIGYSPDGFAGEGLIEIKCPKSTTHLGYLEAKSLPSQYKPQVQFGLFVTDRPWCDFISYDPRFPENLQMLIVRVERDEEYIAMLQEEVGLFLGEVEEMYNRLKEKEN
jgi:putative phage-type endonuclease